MSYLKRLADRMQSTSTASLLRPKGLHAASPTSIARQPPNPQPGPNPESDEMLSSVRRQPAPDDPMALRRRESEPTDEMAAPLRRQPEQEDEAALVRRRDPMEEQPDPASTRDGEASPLRRQPPSEDVDAQRKAVRRNENEAESESAVDEPARELRSELEDEALPLRRVEAAQDAPGAFGSDDLLATEELAAEEVPIDARALRRQGVPFGSSPPAAGAGNGLGPPAPSIAPPTGNPDGEKRDLPGVIIPEAMNHSAPPEQTPASSPSPGFERPQVVIDQIDVMIQQPTGKSVPTSSRSDQNRLVRARYLKRY